VLDVMLTSKCEVDFTPGQHEDRYMLRKATTYRIDPMRRLPSRKILQKGRERGISAPLKRGSSNCSMANWDDIRPSCAATSQRYSPGFETKLRRRPQAPGSQDSRNSHL